MSTNEGFREIQLNGKQLVFLFMAATVVLVVSFLFGVLVGRDVRADRSIPAETASAAVVPDPVAAPPARSSSAASVQLPADPPAPAEDLSYFDRLQKNDTPKESLKSSPPTRNATTAPAPRTPAPPTITAPKPAPADAHPAALPAGEPAGPGFAVQVTTAPDRRAADTLVKQLINKGYPAFVAGPVNSSGRSIYRIRVGKYKTSKEAEAVSKRLENEEPFKFKPWIAR